MAALRQALPAISIHALLAESDHYDNYNLHCVEISIHALLAESDNQRIGIRVNKTQFLSTLSLRRATHYDNYNLHCVEISIHALLAESDNGHEQASYRVSISIHALLAESDALDISARRGASISIHALLAESDCTTTTIICIVPRFLSTLSLRRATRTT